MAEYGIDNYFNLIITNFNSSDKQIKECKEYMLDLFDNQIKPGDLAILVFDEVFDTNSNKVLVAKKSINVLKITNDKFYIYFDNIFLSRRENILGIEFFSGFVTNYIFYSIKVFKREKFQSAIKLNVFKKPD
jgi:hypothetical protein